MTSKKITTIKWQYVALGVLLIVLLLGLRNCKGGGSFFSCNGPDTISVKKDTVIYRDSVRIVYVPTPIEVIRTKVKWFEKIVHDTLPPIRDYDYALPCDSVAVNAYFKTVIYDTVLDGTRWSARIKDTVTQNRLVGRSISVNTSDTTITNTVTLRQPKRVVGYVGLVGQYPFAVGADFSLKGKNDRMYSAGLLLTENNKFIYQLGARFPIRLFPKLKN